MSYYHKGISLIMAVFCLALVGCDKPVGQQSNDSSYDVAMERAEEQFEAAKDRCENLSNDQKEICLENARAEYQRDKQNANSMTAKHNPRITTSPQSQAEYEAAIKECERLSGDAYQECIDQAKDDYQQ